MFMQNEICKKMVRKIAAFLLRIYSLDFRILIFAQTNNLTKENLYNDV